MPDNALSEGGRTTMEGMIPMKFVKSTLAFAAGAMLATGLAASAQAADEVYIPILSYRLRHPPGQWLLGLSHPRQRA